MDKEEIRINKTKNIHQRLIEKSETERSWGKASTSPQSDFEISTGQKLTQTMKR